jgi:hypothetical protein
VLHITNTLRNSANGNGSTEGETGTKRTEGREGRAEANFRVLGPLRPRSGQARESPVSTRASGLLRLAYHVELSGFLVGEEEFVDLIGVVGGPVLVFD